MAITTIANIALDIEKVVQYSIQETTNNMNLVECGVMTRDAKFDELASSTGKTVKMPYWNDLTGDSQVLPTNGTSELETKAISSGKDAAVIHHRGQAFKVNDLVVELAKVQANDPNADPMAAIASRLGMYWVGEYQNIMLATLKGAFGASSMAELVHNIASETTAATRTINAETLIDAEGRLGDAGSKLKAIMVHSVVERKLRKDDLIDFVKPSEGGIRLPYYGDKRIIVNDNMPVETVGEGGDAYKVYTSYLFGEGAIALGEDSNPEYPLLETTREALKGNDILVSRRKNIIHVRGCAFKGSYADVSPTNTELATGTNYERAFEPKNIRVVQFKHRVA